MSYRSTPEYYEVLITHSANSSKLVGPGFRAHPGPIGFLQRADRTYESGDSRMSRWSRALGFGTQEPTRGSGVTVCGNYSSSNIGAFIIRIGFGAHYSILIIRNPQNSTGNY